LGDVGDGVTRRHWQADDEEMRRTGTDDLDLPLFQAPPVKHLARVHDPATSKMAAVDIQDHLPELQRKVWHSFVEHGAMTPKEAEVLPEFQDYGFSTIRRRCSEGLKAGWLRRTGEIRGGSAVLEAV